MTASDSLHIATWSLDYTFTVTPGIIPCQADCYIAECPLSTSSQHNCPFQAALAHAKGAKGAKWDDL